MESTSSFSLNAIAIVWQTSIEPFLALDDTIATAQTCQALHNTIIDAETGEVKVSHFTFVRCPDQYASYLPWALNCIHFPSLRRLHYPPFREPFVDHDQQILAITLWGTRHKSDSEKDAIEVCFPIFVAKLSQARNLEFLFLSMYSMMQTEYNGDSLKWIIRAFGRNLTRCKKLKELFVINDGSAVDPNAVGRAVFLTENYCSIGLMQALTPTLMMRKNDLEALSFDIRGRATDIELESRDGCQIATAFFSAILSATRLKHLEIEVNLSPLLMNSLMEAASRGLNANNVRGLKHLKLHFEETHMQPRMLQPVVPLIEHFSHCESVRLMQLKIPREWWSERGLFRAFAQLIHNKHRLFSLSCEFNGYRDEDSEVLKIMTDFVRGFTDLKKDVIISKLKGGNVFYLRSLAKLFKDYEAKCLNQDEAVINLSDCMEITVDISSLSLSHFRM